MSGCTTRPPGGLHRRRQIDPYGNVNSTCIYGKGDYIKPQTRFTGSGGANGIAGFCNTIIMMQHQKRRFMEKIDYITSWPAGMDGPGGRERAGLPGNRVPRWSLPTWAS